MPPAPRGSRLYEPGYFVIPREREACSLAPHQHGEGRNPCDHGLSPNPSQPRAPLRRPSLAVAPEEAES